MYISYPNCSTEKGPGKHKDSMVWNCRDPEGVTLVASLTLHYDMGNAR